MYPSTEDQRKFLKRLSEIDFGPVAFKLIHADDQKPWTLERATSAIQLYRRFLFLNYLYPDQTIVPSREIDQVWHTHILDTAKYREDCDALFGRFMDHWPYLGVRDEADRQALDDAFDETQKLFAKHFGGLVSA